jgi:hypothetical protein
MKLAREPPVLVIGEQQMPPWNVGRGITMRTEIGKE